MGKVLTDAEKIVLLSRKVPEAVSNPLDRMDMGDLVLARFKVKQMDGSFKHFEQEGTVTGVNGDLFRIELITPIEGLRDVWTWKSMCIPQLTSKEI